MGGSFFATLRVTDTQTALLAGRHWCIGWEPPPKVGGPATLGSWNDRICRFHSGIGNTVKYDSKTLNWHVVLRN